MRFLMAAEADLFPKEFHLNNWKDWIWIIGFGNWKFDYKRFNCLKI